MKGNLAKILYMLDIVVKSILNHCSHQAHKLASDQPATGSLIACHKHEQFNAICEWMADECNPDECNPHVMFVTFSKGDLLYRVRVL